MQVVPEHMASQATAPSIKVWQAWPGRHQFLCDGRVMVGPDISVTAFAAILTTVSSVAFWTYVCNRLPGYTLAIGCVLFLLTIVFMVKTATTDPGIVPSNRGMEQAEADACAQERRTVEINGVAVPLKWCRTCHIFRPPRAAHCSECNVCVDRFDHHCPWMGQCIGRRNYRFFLGFVNSCVLLCAYTIGLSGVAIYRAAQADAKQAAHGDFISHAVVRTPAGVGLVGFCALILLCVGPLACCTRATAARPATRAVLSSRQAPRSPSSLLLLLLLRSRSPSRHAAPQTTALSPARIRPRPRRSRRRTAPTIPSTSACAATATRRAARSASRLGCVRARSSPSPSGWTRAA